MTSGKNFKVATFNVNSVRTRMPIILRWLEKNTPDVLCMQETKVSDELFPVDEFAKLDYSVIFHGQKSYNGVAIAYKENLKKSGSGLGDIDEPDQARLIWADIAGVKIVNTYVPQGRDPESEYFQYKLNWFKRLKKFLEKNFKTQQKVLLCGDLNVAPEDIDLHDPKGTKNHPCFNPQVTEALYDVMSWGLVDVFRKYHPEPGQYSWFNYLFKDSVIKNKGWRVDFILATKALTKKSSGSYIDMEPRREEQPSDHTPVVAEFLL